ncbi:CBS domain-containing protein CBSX6 [Senna tora]|uniref:CBS domain-containing protein CBSX6 n=1 Tax=Senna tora TaxID=362788 RepID=A0A834T979_9FABA|nr:CBS domain-containing protein CBSX6 [Senna tora]
MASVLVYHVVGDLTVGKREVVEFIETETVESAIREIGESAERSISIWKRRSNNNVGSIESIEMREQRFVGMLNSLDIVSFLAKSKTHQDKAFNTPVSEVVVPNNSLLRLVDPGTRLIDALELMKQGVRRLLVPKTVAWKGASKRFSIVYNGKWMKNNNVETSSCGSNVASNMNYWGSNNYKDTFCCLSREDVLRFIIGCLGALAPLPLTSITVLGAINSNYSYVESSSPASEAIHEKNPQGPSAVAVVVEMSRGEHKMIGEISACQLWKCDYIKAAWALANVSAGEFVLGVVDQDNAGGKYRGRSAPLTCKTTTSLAAVMAQMLSHRASHVWVTQDDDDHLLAGVLGYADVFAAVTKPPTSLLPAPAPAPNRTNFDGL